MTESATRSHAEPQDEPTLYTAYELDFMLSLRDTDSARITRDQIGLRPAPEAAQEFVAAAVTAGLHARGKVELSDDGQWLLGGEAQVIASALTSADRWLGIALSQGDAMRMAFILQAGETILMLTQDELDTFQASALPDTDTVATSVAEISSSFLGQEAGRTVSLRRTDLSDPQTSVPLMFHTEQDGSWKVGHLPLDADGVLSVDGLASADVRTVVARLWADGVSAAV